MAAAELFSPRLTVRADAAIDRADFFQVSLVGFPNSKG
jgi:hypothetical protein